MSSEQTFSRFRLGGIAILVVGASTIAALWASQRASVGREARRLTSDQEAGPRVRTAVAGLDAGARTLDLPGEALPHLSTTLYAKVAGFLREIRVDKGSPVTKGQVIAVLESTEVDTDFRALKADALNKRTYAQRLRQLDGQGIISARDLEDAETAARIAEEKLASQGALRGYRNVTAPFAGVVTQRFADPGALIQNAGNSLSSQPLVSLAQVDHLRVTFYLDQAVASRVKVGQALTVRPSDRPDLARPGKVARLSGALDPRTRTLLAEADLDNRDGAFVAGGAVQVSLDLPREAGRLEIPSEAVLLKGDRTLAAVVGADGKVLLRPLVLGEDSGARVRVMAGLQAGERVILNPAITLKDGDRVQATDSPGRP
ncbi:efflux RND transporter periplasmic adaptor subunit [Mesoterricola silvestris]|uniref:RND transporter MFP subunit n=1 Tax=Mesoterricola silvestris TaxID=2927979 RepID=A0AA48GSH6_9BACT|nr:efflux RND transporter periplasmic adaptor subunit [Mesoterricola silvestris]BDU73455.1 RND transporter MFP subunit [Mesoterricola silvestris]